MSVSPTLGLTSFTVLLMIRSASWPLVGVFAELLRLFGSQTSLSVIVTMLNPVVALSACTWIVSVSGLETVAESGTVPTSQMPVAESNVPTDGVAPKNVTFAWKASVTFTPVAADVPRLNRLTV